MMCSSAPAPTRGKRVMPIGDSITEALAYRVELDTMLRSLGTARTCGTRGNTQTPYVPHQGYSGWHTHAGAAGLQNVVVGPLQFFEPDVVLLLAGINDLLHDDPRMTPAQTAASHLQLLDLIIATVPTATVLVCTLTPIAAPWTVDVPESSVVATNTLITANVATRLGEGKNVVLVDLHAAFVAQPNWETLLADGLHPNVAGYQTVFIPTIEPLMDAALL